MNDRTPTKSLAGVVGFLAFVCSWSACFWLLSAFVNVGQPPEQSFLFLIGGAGPLIGVVVFTHLQERRITGQSVWLRALDPRRLPFRWLCLSLLLHPAIMLCAVGVDQLLGSRSVTVSLPQGGLIGFSSLLFFTFWFGPFPEEIAWRGYALDRLQRRYTALRASMILGVIWAGWHLPLFAVPGTFQHTLGFSNLRFWFFLASMVPLSVLLTWVYNSSQGSTLSAVMIHFSGNLCGALLPKTTRLAGIEFALLTLCAVMVVIRFGSKHLLDLQLLKPTLPQGTPSK